MLFPFFRLAVVIIWFWSYDAQWKCALKLLKQGRIWQPTDRYFVLKGRLNIKTTQNETAKEISTSPHGKTYLSWNLEKPSTS